MRIEQYNNEFIIFDIIPDSLYDSCYSRAKYYFPPSLEFEVALLYYSGDAYSRSDIDLALYFNESEVVIPLHDWF